MCIVWEQMHNFLRVSARQTNYQWLKPYLFERWKKVLYNCIQKRKQIEPIQWLENRNVIILRKNKYFSYKHKVYTLESYNFVRVIRFNFSKKERP